MKRIMKMHSEKGFNLPELMIVVAIIGILAAIAYPMYNQHLMETRRADGWIALTTAEMAQLRWHSVNFSYTGDVNNLGGADSPENFYTISVAIDNDNTTFTLTATAKADGPQAGDTGCTVLTLNHIGIRTPDACW